MNPLIDEKMILTTSSAFMELAYDWLGINIVREAYGPTDNEGLCHEYCCGISLKGDVKGHVFLGLDGYTKLLMLPYIAKKFSLEEHPPEVVESSLLSFMNQFAGLIATELQEFITRVDTGVPQIYSHKLLSLPTEKFRKYALIFFLKDEEKQAYLGRAYLFLAIGK